MIVLQPVWSWLTYLLRYVTITLAPTRGVTDPPEARFAHALFGFCRKTNPTLPPPSQTETTTAVPNKHTHTYNNDWLATDKAAVKHSLVVGMNADSQTPRQTLVRTTHTTLNTN